MSETIVLIHGFWVTPRSWEQWIDPRTRRAGCTSAHIPASGEIFWGSALADVHPGKDDAWVNYQNTERARRCCSSPAAPTT